MGMPHRGRLNVLAHILRKPYELILGEFEGILSALGRPRRRRRQVPSRLFARPHGAQRAHHPPVDERESESPRGHQSRRGGDRPRQAGRTWPTRRRRRVVPVLMHGDAAFMGQGIGLRDAHAVGAAMPSPPAAPCTSSSTTRSASPRTPPTTAPRRFPSDARAGRSTRRSSTSTATTPRPSCRRRAWPSAFARPSGATSSSTSSATARHGHNEGDDPSLTQPALYKRIREHPDGGAAVRSPARGGRGDRCGRAAGASGRPRALGWTRRCVEAREHMPRQKVFAFGGVWQGLTWAGSDWSADTAVKAERLRAVAEVLRHPPAGFTLQARAKRLLDERYQMVERGEGIDWGCAETLAYGTLLLEGFPVRLSRPGHRARHLQPPPRRALRRRDRRRLGAAQPTSRPDQALVRGREQPALRDGRARLRVRDVERRSPAPRRVGGAVRRLRQRRAGRSSTSSSPAPSRSGSA